MVDGTKITEVAHNCENKSKLFKFTGNVLQRRDNTIALREVTSFANICALRCLLVGNTPLNKGCLDPILMKVKKTTIANPTDNEAVIERNGFTSQRVSHVILVAFRACVASQDCMKDMTFEDKKRAILKQLETKAALELHDVG